jgi:hypothetical protein
LLYVWVSRHLQEVEKLSPAALAGLQPGKDYLLGTAERVFKGSPICVTHTDLQRLAADNFSSSPGREQIRTFCRRSCRRT